MRTTQTPSDLGLSHDTMERAARIHSLVDLSISDLVLDTLRDKPGLKDWKIAKIDRFKRLTEKTRKSILASGNGPSDPSLHAAYAAKMRIEKEFSRLLTCERMYATIAEMPVAKEIIDGHDRDLAATFGMDVNDPRLLETIRFIHPHIDAAIGNTVH